MNAATGETQNPSVRGFAAVKVYLEMIKFEHSIFALPFALTGMMWAARGWPSAKIFGWIVVAMVSCRSAAMAYNRILDRDIDALNPRTKMRAIPAGLLSLKQVNLFFAISILIFLYAAWALNPLCLLLSPIALLVVLGYSACKRFTPLCHFVLGLSLGIAPAAAWIGTTGTLQPGALLLFGGVSCWTAGFDLIYSLQDEEFDREQGLRSLPQTLGKAPSLLISRLLHGGAILFLGAAAYTVGVGVLTYVGVGFAAALLIYEQSLVKPNDLSRVNLAFFTLNGFVSLGFFAFAGIDRLIGGWA